MKHTAKARLGLIGSMIIFGTLGPFVRTIGLPSGELALYRAILAVAVLGGFQLIAGDKPDRRAIRKAVPCLLLSGAAMGVNWIFLFQAYRFTTVSSATLSYYFAPVLVMILSALLFRERLHLRQIVCFLGSTLGLGLLVAGGGLDAGSDDAKGIALGLAAAVLYAAVMLLNKHIRQVSGLHRTLLQFAAAITVLLPYVALTGGVHLGSLQPTGWLCLLTVGLFHTGFTYYLYFSSLKELPGQEIALLSYIDPLVAVLVSVLILQEPVTGLQMVGGGLILGFTLWNNRTKS